VQPDRDDEFRRKLALGNRFEVMVAAWLKSRRFYLLPVYDYSGLGANKAPKLEAQTPYGSLVLPDLLVARDGGVKFVEVKYKDRADWTRITQRFETGINLRLWLHYRKVQVVSGIPVWLMFVHQQEDEIRGGWIDDLAALKPRKYEGQKMGRSGMVFFPWDGLKRQATLSEISAQFAPRAA
jgi:hypothetical protein